MSTQGVLATVTTVIVIIAIVTVNSSNITVAGLPTSYPEPLCSFLSQGAITMFLDLLR